MAIKHEPKFYVRLCYRNPVNFPGNFKVYSGSIYGRYSDLNGKPIFWVCDNYAFINGKLPIHIYDGIHWKLCLVDQTHSCYKWVKYAIEKIGKVPKVELENLRHKDYSNLMKANTRHKKGSGSRINTHQINQPLRWNEVTELAHWNGKGNASVVAAGIR